MSSGLGFWGSKVVAAPPAAVVQFAPGSTPASITLSNSNLTALKASGGGAYVSAFNADAQTSGKLYAVIRIDANATPADGILFGVRTAASVAASLGTYIGVDANSAGYNSGNGSCYTSGTQVGSGPTTGPGDTIGILFDFTTGILTGYHNGIAGPFVTLGLGLSLCLGVSFFDVGTQVTMIQDGSLPAGATWWPN